MKKKIFIIFLAALIIFIFVERYDFFYYINKVQARLLKVFVRSMKNKDLLYGGILVFSYGVIHSLGPGHGKIFLSAVSVKDKKRLFFYSFLIAYIQGLISVLIIYFIFKNKGVMQNYNRYLPHINQYFYSVALMLLAVINIMNLFAHKKIDEKIPLIGLFLPCPGVISILLATIILGYKKYIFFTALIMSTGIFTTLAVFSFLLTKIKVTYKKDKFFTVASLSFYSLIFVIGVLMSLPFRLSWSFF